MSNPRAQLENTGILLGYRAVLSALSSAPQSTLDVKSLVYALAAETLTNFKAEWNSSGKLQSLQRGRLGRRHCETRRKEKQEQDTAATRLQNVRRGQVAKSRVSNIRKVRDDGAASKLQAAHRGKTSRDRVTGMRKEKERLFLEQQNGAATVLQSHSRRRKSQLEFTNKMEIRNQLIQQKQSGAATKLQAMQRGKLAKKKVQDKRDGIDQQNAATKMQAIQRGKSQRNQRKAEEGAAQRMQSIQRGRIGRNQANQKKTEFRTAIILQSRIRGWKDRAVARQKQRAKSMLPIGDGNLHIGDVVKAKVAGDILYCEGIIIGKSGSDGVDEYDVDFGEGDIQEHVPKNNIRKVHHWDILEVGDQIKAPVPDMPSLSCDATIQMFEGEVGGENFYTIEFADDGEICKGVRQSVMVKVSSKRTKAVQRWIMGANAISAASAFGDKKWGMYRRLSVSAEPNALAAKTATQK